MDEQIKPVAYRQYYERDYERDGCDGEFKLWELGPQMSPPDGTEPLYPQQSIDALRAEVERLRAENQMLGEVALAVPGEIDRVSKLKDGVVDFLVARAERAEAEAESLMADAERYRAMRDEFLWSMVSDTERTDLTLHMPGVSLAAIGPNSDDFDAAIDAARKGAEEVRYTITPKGREMLNGG